MNRALIASLMLFIGLSLPASQNPEKQEAKQPTVDVLDIKLGEVRFKYQPSPPKYPRAASDAGVSGNVFLVIIVDEEGKVSSAKAVSGPVELYPASEEWWSKHLFHPFIKDGQTRVVRFTVVAPWRLRR